MASVRKGQTTVSFPEPASFVIDLAIPEFSPIKTHTVYRSEKVSVFRSFWYLGICLFEKVAIEGKEVSCVQACLWRECHDEGRAAPDIYVELDFGIVENARGSKMNPRFCSRNTHLFSMRLGKNGTRHLESRVIIWGDSSTPQLEDDTLTVRAVVKCSVVKENRKRRTPVTEVLQKRNCEMHSLNIGRDFVLVSSDGSEHPTHKIVLSAMSPVFRRMLESDVKETRTGRCEISDVDEATLEGLLRFMYLGCVEAVKENAMKLLEAADKYEVLDLKDLCEDALIEELNMDNVVNMLCYAEKMSAPELKLAAVRYVAADPEKTMASDGMKELLGSAKAELIAEVFNAMLKPLLKSPAK